MFFFVCRTKKNSEPRLSQLLPHVQWPFFNSYSELLKEDEIIRRDGRLDILNYPITHLNEDEFALLPETKNILVPEQLINKKSGLVKKGKKNKEI